MLDRPFLPKKPSVLCGPCIMTSFLGATLFGVMWAMNFENHKHHYIGSIILSLTGLIALARYFRFYGRIHECTTV